MYRVNHVRQLDCIVVCVYMWVGGWVWVWVWVCVRASAHVHVCACIDQRRDSKQRFPLGISQLPLIVLGFCGVKTHRI